MKKVALLFFLLPLFLRGQNNLIYNSLKEMELEKYLQGSPVYDQCAGKNKMKKWSLEEIQAASDCLEKKISSLKPNEIEQLKTQLNLSPTTIQGGMDQKNMAQYFRDLFQKSLKSKALKGDNAQNIVSDLTQEDYINIYHSQIGTMLFWEMANFCLKSSSLNASKPTLENVVSYLKNNPEAGKECLQLVDKANCKELTTSENKESCSFHQKLLQYRAVIKQLQEDKKYLAEIKKTAKQGGIQWLTEEQSPSTTNLKELSLMSSTDLKNSMGDEKNKTRQKMLEDYKKQCIDNPTKACTEFISNGSQENLGQLRLQKELEIELKINEMKAVTDKDKLKEIAEKSHLLTEGELEELKKKDINEIKNDIEKKYQEEKTILKEKITSEIKSTGISKESELKNAKDQLTNISEILKDKPEELRAITYLASYLSANFNLKNSKNESMGSYNELAKYELKKLDQASNNALEKEAYGLLKPFAEGRETAKESTFSEPTTEFIDLLLKQKTN
jgi:hypothetical protein